MNDQQRRANNSAAAAGLFLLFLAMITGIAGCIAFGVQYPGGAHGAALGCGIFGAAALYGFVKVLLSRIS